MVLAFASKCNPESIAVLFSNMSYVFLQVLRLKHGRRFCSLGRLGHEVGTKQ